MKRCEVCNIKIPDDYGNLLCDKHYEEYVKKQESIKEDKVKEVAKQPDTPTNPASVCSTMPATGENTAPDSPKPPVTDDKERYGILDDNYVFNPEMDDKNQILANLAQFIYSHDEKRGRKGVLLWYIQRNMYTFIKNYCMQKTKDHPQSPFQGGKHLWKPKIVDVGCGSGVGSNILSLEADFVWGIDKNSFSIEFAKETFTREKNGIYYSSQLTFDQIDVMTDTRQFMAFDIVVAIEIIEHIGDTHTFLNSLKRFGKNRKGNYKIPLPTEFFISSPNRNSRKIRNDKPENIYHTKEWTSQELKALLLLHFEEIELMNIKGEPVADDSIEDVVFAKCWHPIV